MRYSIENSVENYLTTQRNEIKLYNEDDNSIEIIHDQILIFYGAEVDEIMGQRNRVSRYEVLTELQIRKPFLASGAITDWMLRVQDSNYFLRGVEVARFKEFLREQDDLLI